MFSKFAVRRLSVPCVALVFAAGLYAALPGEKLEAGETRVNSTVLLAQQAPAVARDADGDYVVVWAGATATDAGNVYLQRYGSDGIARGDEVVVNTTTAGTQSAPAVAMDASGNFVVVWAGNGAQTGQVDADGIFLQRYAADGSEQGAEVRANTTTTGVQDLPAVAMDADGDFVVAWQSLSQDGSGQGVYAQRFNAAGVAQGTEFQANTYTTGSQRDASVAMDLDGDFVIVWESNGQDGALNGIYGKVYAADGTAGTEFAVNTTTAGSQDNPVVGLRADGEFIVAWSGPDADGTGIYARRFDSTGGPIDANEFAVNTSTAGTQAAPAIALAAEGSFLVAWESNHAAGNYDIIARRYDAAGTAGTEGQIVANSTAALDQTAAAVALDADGDGVIVWQGNGTGDAEGVFARRVVGPEAVDVAITKADSPDPVSTGGLLTYTLTVANLHPAVTPTGDATVDGAIGAAAGITVVDTLPSGSGDNVSFVSAEGTGWTCSNSASTSVTCTLDAALPADSEAEPITISVLAPSLPPADRTLSNSASVTSDQHDPEGANDTAVEETAVCGPGESAGTLNVVNTTTLESSGFGPVRVARSGGTCGSVSVQVNFAAGTATLGEDFPAAAPQTLTWPNGESGEKTGTPIVITNDTVFEAAETVLVTLSNAQRATAGSNGTITINDNDTAPTLSIADNAVLEGNSGTTTLPLTVTLTPAPGTTIGRTITVEYDTANGTATTADADYVAVTDGVVTFTAGQSTQVINLTVNGDGKNEDDETVTVTLSNPVPSNVGITDATATATLSNDDPLPTVAFAAATSSVSEAATNPPFNNQAPTLDVTVTLSAASSKTVTVALSNAGSTAALPADYSLNPLSTVTFAPGQTSRTVTITVALDSLDENDETVNLTLSSPTNATLGAQTTHVATIIDDDASPALTIASAPTSLQEDATGTAKFTVTLSAVSGRDVTVTYGLSGTATLGAGADYTIAPAPGQLTIPAGSTTTDVTVTPVDDALDENNETVIATLSAPQNATVGSPGSATLTINDEDATPSVSFAVAAQSVDENVAGGTATVTVSLSAVSGRAVTVPFTINAAPGQAGDASNGVDFTITPASPLTIPAGSPGADIVVHLIDDATNEVDEKVRLAIDTANLGNATAGATTAHVTTIVNDDTLPQVSFAAAAQSAAEGAGTATIAVQLNRPAEQDVTVSYALSGSALTPSEYTVSPASPFIIAEGESSAVLTVTLVDDARVESTETVVVTLTGAVNATVVDAAKTHTLSVTNDDTAGVIVAESGGSTDVIEGGAEDTYTVVLTSEPAANVTIFPTSGGETTTTTSVTFTPGGATAWNIPQEITVTAVDDVAGEGPHTDTIANASSSADPNYDGLAVASVTANITDNDVPAIVIEQSAGGTTVAEGGATDSYTVALSAQPAQDVVVNLTPDAQVTLSTGTLTFTSVDWATPQPVTVTAVDDDVAEGTHPATVAHASTSADANFNGLAADLTAEVTDDETAGVILSKTGATATEGGAGDSYTLRLASQPVGDVVVTLTPDAQVAVDVTEIVFTAVNWNLEVPVAVTAVDDSLDEASPHAGTVVHAVSATASDANYDGLAVADLAVAVTDDDAAPSVTLSLAGSPLAENAGMATVTATLSAVSGRDVTVTLAFTGSATDAVDYTRPGSSITIPAGAASGDLVLTGVDDAVDEADETVVVDITGVTNGTESGAQQVTAVIADDDSTPTVTLSLAGSPLAENGGVATVTATLSAASGQDVTVDLGFSGSATTPADYAASAGAIVISAGATTGSITISSVDDALDEANETVVVDITGVTNGTESGTQQVTASILDDDAPPTVTLSLAGSPLAENGGVATVTATLSAVSGQAVTVNLALAGTAAAADYVASGTAITIAAGSTSGSITLTGADDAIDEADETVVVDVSSVSNGTESGTQQVTATIADDDAPPTVTLSAAPLTIAEASGTATLTATLSEVSGQAVTVTLGFTGTATNPSDYSRSATAITIAAGSLTGTAQVTAVNDTGDEPNETVVVDITAVANGTESGTQQVTITITDDDAPPPSGDGGSFGLLGLWLLLPAWMRRHAGVRAR